MSQSPYGCPLFFLRAGAGLTQLCRPAPIRVPGAQNACSCLLHGCFHLTMDLARELLEVNMPSVSALKMNGQRSLLYSSSPGIAHPTPSSSSKHDLFTANHRGDPRREGSVVAPIPTLSGRLSWGVWAAPRHCLVCTLRSPPSGWVTLKANLLSLVAALLILGLHTQCVKHQKSYPCFCK